MLLYNLKNGYILINIGITIAFFITMLVILNHIKLLFRTMENHMNNHFNNSCDAFDCAVQYVYTFSCTTYLHNPKDLNCAIPCFLSNCSKSIVQQWVLCPIWKCSTPYIPLIPSLPLEHSMSTAVIVLSLLGTIMLTFILTCVGIKIYRKWARRNYVALMPPNQHAIFYGKNNGYK